jgi:peptidoglycan/LPS O-acetylase OafA/YrhL
MSTSHLKVLDGWRGVSILLVLAAHLLPLGPKLLQLNFSVGILGMVLFFILSGFLITSSLLKDENVIKFIIHRFFRVVPLAWLYLSVALIISGASVSSWIAHYFFFANLPPKELLLLTDHFWSLCVEMQFYVCIAMLVAFSRGKGIVLIPIICVLFTGFRVWDSIYSSSITYYRIDEILSGCTLAIFYHGRLRISNYINPKKVPQLIVLFLLIISCMPQSGWINYLRPYLAALLIGLTIVNPETSMVRKLNAKLLAYLAAISFALYVLHPLLAASWLGSGDVLVKYIKRPLLFSILFPLAHLSTFYFEKRFINYGKALSLKVH